MAANTNYDPAWFEEGFQWGEDRTLISAGIGFRCYVTHEWLIQRHSNDRRRVFECRHEGCGFKLGFSKRKRLGWTVQKAIEHSDDCLTLNLTDEYISNVWKNNKGTLVPTEILADMCRTVLLETLDDIRGISPSQITTILKERKWLPPLWELKRINWLHSLSHIIRDHILRESPTILTSSLSEHFELFQKKNN